MTKLGKYELIEPLGSGATSEVYLARDTVLNRQISLKILRPALVADPTAFERFTHEAQAAAGLFHPNIATVLDMGEADGRYFIAMRYIPGQSLDKYIAEHGPLSWDDTLRLARQMSEALDYAHEQGFLHRDVKPSNIIRSSKGDYVLTDFGLQRAMLSTGLTTHTGVVLGTPPYIAPEVWDGKAAMPATDQYALACVIYEVLTGKVLFAGDTPMAVLKRHSDGWTPPAEWPRGVSNGLDKVFERALAQKTEDRYQTTREFANALNLLLAGQGTKEDRVKPTAPETLKIESAMAKRGVALWIFGIVSALIIGIWVLSVMLKQNSSISIPSSAAKQTVALTSTISLATTPAVTVASTPSSSVDIARPSNSGGPGLAINLIGDASSGKQIFANNCQACHNPEGKGGIPNPGSTHETVPSLNPIDPSLISADAITYTTNLDLFIEHGSMPEGNSPTFMMPAWGDKKALTPQQIADVIAYIINLNPATPR